MCALSIVVRISYRTHWYGSSTMIRRRGGRERELVAELSAARETAGLSMRELSARLKRSQNFCHLVESGTRSISVVEFLDWCQVVGADPAAIIQRVS